MPWLMENMSKIINLIQLKSEVETAARLLKSDQTCQYQYSREPKEEKLRYTTDRMLIYPGKYSRL